MTHRHARFRMALSLSCWLLSGLLLAAATQAAFELRVLSPAERTCTGPEALGLVEGSVSTIFHGSSAGRHKGVIGAYGYRPFGLDGIDVFALRGRVTPGRMRTGVCFSYSGLVAPGYGEQVVSVSMGISRGDLWLQPGLRFAQARAPGLYEGHCVIFDFTTYAYVTPHLRVSFEVGNAFASSLSAPGGAVPRRVRAGLGYAISASVACGLSVEKENGLRTALGTGLEWRATGGFFVRLGSCTFPRECSLGLGLHIRGLALDLSSTVNFDLGMTHEAGIMYAWK